MCFTSFYYYILPYLEPTSGETFFFPGRRPLQLMSRGRQSPATGLGSVTEMNRADGFMLQKEPVRMREKIKPRAGGATLRQREEKYGTHRKAQHRNPRRVVLNGERGSTWAGYGGRAKIYLISGNLSSLAGAAALTRFQTAAFASIKHQAPPSRA